MSLTSSLNTVVDNTTPVDISPALANDLPTTTTPPESVTVDTAPPIP